MLFVDNQRIWSQLVRFSIFLPNNILVIEKTTYMVYTCCYMNSSWLINRLWTMHPCIEYSVDIGLPSVLEPRRRFKRTWGQLSYRSMQQFSGSNARANSALLHTTNALWDLLNNTNRAGVMWSFQMVALDKMILILC